MTLEEAKTGDFNEHTIVFNKEQINDSRWKGWEKYRVSTKSDAGKDSVVHYFRNPKTGERADFKFKKHSDE